MHERVPQEAVEPAPAPARAPATGGPAPLVTVPGIMRSLQRSVGNATVARMLVARDTAPAEAVPLGGGAGAKPAGGAGPKPTFDHSGGSTVPISANSAVEFSRAITAQIGSPHTQPVFTPAIDVDFKTDAAGQEVPGSRKIKKIGLSVKTSIVKVRFGGGSPDKENKAMIDRMVKEIQAHEERHRAIVETAATAALADVQQYVGTDKTAEADAALTTGLETTTNTGHEALDATEGLLTVSEVRQPDGSIKLELTKSASGAKYN